MNTGLFAAVAGAALFLASGAVAQDQGAATTRSLNEGPAQSNLSTRPNAQPPLTPAERGQKPTEAQAVQPRATRPQTSAADRTLEDLLGQTADQPAPSSRPTVTPPSVTLAPGATEPEPIPMTLGYYVRGDKDCDQVWPGEGDLAWLTPTAFTIDFGGCEPGQFLQTGPNSWSEEQRCRTERGGDAGAYNVTYEVIGTDVIKRTARLEMDEDAVEDDLWRFCRLEDVPENARFGS